MSCTQVTTDCDVCVCVCAGEVIFSGTGSQALAHFASIGHACPAFTNPLDHIIDISSIDTRSEAAELQSAEQVCSVSLVFGCRDPNASVSRLG